MLLEIIKAIILGVVEGVTEFLPVSSTGHLILVNEWINFSQPFTTMFDIVIQLGAILAVMVFFWKRLWPFGKNRLEASYTYNIWYKVIIGVLPAIVLGALLGDFVEEKLFNPFVVAVALLVGGLILIYIERKKLENNYISVGEMPLRIAFYIGLIQCLAMIPGTSRSAATIIGAMLLGTSRLAAVEFSFFLAIPTMAAATGYSLLKHGSTISGSEIIILIIGFLSAFFTAWFIIKGFINYIKNRDFKPFGYYRIILGAIILIYFLLK